MSLDDQLAENFGFEGDVCATVHTMAGLQAFSEAVVGIRVLDLTPEEERVVFVNGAFLKLTGQTRERCQNELGDTSTTLRAMRKALWQKVQVTRSTYRGMKTFYPDDKKPINVFWIFRPMQLVLEDGTERTVILTHAIPVATNADKEASTAKMSEMMVYSTSIQMMIDIESLEIEYGNTPAKNFYGTSGCQMQLPDRRMTLLDVFDCCQWREANERSELWDQVRALTLKSSPLEFITRIRRPGAEQGSSAKAASARSSSGTETVRAASGASGASGAPSASAPVPDSPAEWHRMVFVPCMNPDSGRAAIILNQDDVTQLQQTQQNLEAANLAQEEAFAQISHELRTPLNGIIGLADALDHGDCADASTKRTLSIIKRTGQRLSCLVNDILDAASSRRSRLVVKVQPCDMKEIADTVIDVIKPLVKPGVEIRSHISQHIPAIQGDPDRLTQVLMNLCANSLKVTARGQITIDAQLKDGNPAGPLLVSVSDTGPGIPHERLEAIWGSFQQVDVATTQRYGGTGLGLSLVRGLVEAHGGSIKVESQFGGRGRGTTFTVTLPLRRGSDATESSRGERRAASDVSARRSQRSEQQDGGEQGQGSSGGEGEEATTVTGESSAAALMKEVQVRALMKEVQSLRKDRQRLQRVVSEQEARAEELKRQVRELEQSIEGLEQRLTPRKVSPSVSSQDRHAPAREMRTVEEQGGGGWRGEEKEGSREEKARREGGDGGGAGGEREELLAWTVRTGNLLVWQQANLARSRKALSGGRAGGMHGSRLGERKREGSRKKERTARGRTAAGHREAFAVVNGGSNSRMQLL